MWAKTFTQRLNDWNVLRAECAALDAIPALEKINSWWHQTPWTPYRLHWDNHDEWPTPWEILDDNIYCPLTRALGMAYTIAILDIPVNAELIETTDGDYLISINDGLQILNWDANTILNTDSPNVARRLPLSYFKDKF